MSEDKTKPNETTTEYPIKIEQLRPGVFIRITSTSWLDHPFLMNSFKITDKEQIKVLRQLKIDSVIFVPSKSDVFPLLETDSSPEINITAPDPQKDEQTKKLWEEKQKRIEKQKIHRKKIAACQKKFSASVETVKNVMKNIEGGRLESVTEADDLLQSIIADLLIERDTTVQLMSTTPEGEGMFYHSLNVSVLAMMLGKEHGLNKEELRILGMGALFHDVGKHKVPKNILYKPTPLSKFELDILRCHPAYGVDTVKPMVKNGTFPDEALWIIQDHHERVDGSGYPSGRKGSSLSILARIVSIVDRYDNLCNNPVDQTKSVTPHEAVAHMFKSERERFDNALLQRFIAYLGVYPPGTIVKTNSGVIGMVITVNSTQSLKPSLLIYDSDIPKAEALIFDLAEDNSLSICGTIRPHELPQEIYDYLSPRTRVSYFIAAQDKKQQSTPKAATPQKK